MNGTPNELGWKEGKDGKRRFRVVVMKEHLIEVNYGKFCKNR